MKASRKTSAPMTPQNRTLCWYAAGTAKKLKISAMRKDIVDGQRLLDQVARVVSLGGLAALPQPQHYPEPHTRGDPDTRPQGSLAKPDHMVVSVHEQVHREHRRDRPREGDPRPRWHGHGELVHLASSLTQPPIPYTNLKRLVQCSSRL